MDIDLDLVLDHQGETEGVASPTAFPEKKGTTGGMRTGLEILCKDYLLKSISRKFLMRKILASDL